MKAIVNPKQKDMAGFPDAKSQYISLYNKKQ